MTCHCTSSARIGTTSRSQREVIHAHGQIGSNQKSTLISRLTVQWPGASRTMWRNVKLLGALLGAFAAGSANAQVLPSPTLGGSPAAFEQMLGGANDAS